MSADLLPFSSHPTPTSRRQSPRINVDGRLVARMVHPNLAVDVRDFSDGGMAIETNASVLPGARHRFRLMTDTGVSVTIWATAVHCRATGAWTPHGARYLSGWRFADAAGAQDAIAQIMEVVTSVLSFD